MRKSLAIWLLFIVSVTQTEFGQLLKLPLLLEHYQKHKNQSKKLSFISYLKDHYTKAHQDQDQAEDKQLPFNAPVSHPPGFALIPPTIEIQKPVRSTGHQFFIRNDHQSLPQFFYTIFHPPRAIAG
jgi:hypothetical protein